MKNNDETILEILQGHKTSKWPAAKLVKIFIASTKTDFVDERRLLLEHVGPELQMIFDEQKIEVELVDMHFGASEKDTIDAKLFEDHLHEIRMCHKLSRGCFFLSLVGSKYAPLIVPPRVEAENFEALIDKVAELGLNYDILENWYFKDGNDYILKDCRFSTLEEWKKISEEMITIIHECLLTMPAATKKNFNDGLKSVVEQQFNFALGLAPGTAHHMLNIFRIWEVPEETETFYQVITFL